LFVFFGGCPPQKTHTTITPFVLWNLAKRALSGAFAKFIELQRGSDLITMLKGLAKKLFRIDWRDRRV
jgi:hypothetical protein